MTDKEKKAAYWKDYKAKNAERIRQQQAAYREKNREKKRLQSADWNSKNKLYRRDKTYQRLYGITIDDYNRMFAEQDGCCAICGIHQTKDKSTFCVDHCHATGKVRGLLCTKCNKALGLFHDNQDLLNKAIHYLQGE